jgi:nucleoside-diphosphate-sugar epimerase
MFSTEAELEDALSEPTPAVIETLRQLDGDLLILGVAGKMGPSLARMAQRAFRAAGNRRRVIGAARFTAGGEDELRAQGIDTIRCNLLDADAVARLPETPLVLYLAGRKFGSTGDEPGTWAQNAYLPGLVGSRFRRSRIVALSTGNVYGLAPVARGGSVETDPLQPVGEYAMSCLGRERIFQYVSQTHGTPVSLIRLNYACDLRYGVLVDLAQQILAGRPIDIGMTAFNTLWQGDANAMTLCAFSQAAAPAWTVNVTGPEILRIRDAAEQLAQHLSDASQKRSARFTGVESDTALLSNPARALELWGPPRLTASELCAAVAAWLKRGGRTLNKPTHFESRDGTF